MYHQIPIALMDDWDDSVQCKIPGRVPLIFLKHNDRYLNIVDKTISHTLSCRFLFLHKKEAEYNLIQYSTNLLFYRQSHPNTLNI